ncbi:putative NF-X1 finger and helicase protein [Planoprotostelium fungivorum]|uniref:Putative NF-X1 finger and helicase protein n=1 Tax=Planoprotostelium fungivorum TaxID=1890364 RepID=A0A2P6NKQ8_9EUKA|nr:putative NF-X1 finger and helicase protein [Planoprotostelium fungivorum]
MSQPLQPAWIWASRFPIHQRPHIRNETDHMDNRDRKPYKAGSYKYFNNRSTQQGKKEDNNRGGDGGRQGQKHVESRHDEVRRFGEKHGQNERHGRSSEGAQREGEKPASPVQKLFWMVKNDTISDQFKATQLVQLAIATAVFDVVSLFGHEDGRGIKLLRTIMEYRVSEVAGNRREFLSYQRCWLPLTWLISREDFTAVNKREELLQIYRAVYECTQFIDKSLECLDNLCQRPSMSDAQFIKRDRDGEFFLLNHWTDAILATLQLIKNIIRQIHDAKANVFVYLKRIESIYGRCIQKGEDLDPNAANRCSKIEANISSIKNLVCRDDEREGNTMPSLQRGFGRLTLRPEGDGPGLLRPLGPRHDNDHRDYRQIEILPTDQEIRCDVAPYLPRRKTEEFDGPGGYLDKPFRLFRQDALSTVMISMRHFSHDDTLKTMRPGQNTCVVEESGQKINLFVYRNMEVENVKAVRKQGIVLTISVDHLVRGNEGERKRYMTEGFGGRQLQIGSLVCMYIAGRGTRGQMYLSQVVVRQDEDMKGEKMRVGLKLLRSDDVGRVVDGIDSRVESVLLQVCGHFFTSVETVLSALQRHDRDTIPFYNHLVEDEPCTAPPEYIDQKEWDLTCLIRQGVRHSEDFRLRTMLERVTMGDYGRLKDTLWRERQYLTLDDTQTHAMASMLSRKISLVQGPPGAGKTYIGIQLVKVLMKNLPMPSAPGLDYSPIILCICYTNHALDQFLEELVEHAGVPQNHILRVGNRSKSSILAESSSLYKLSLKSTFRSTREREIYKEMEIIEADIGGYSLNKTVKLEDLRLIMEEGDYNELRGRDEDGFEENATGDHIQRWLKAKPRRGSSLFSLRRQQKEDRLEHWKKQLSKDERNDLKRNMDRFEELNRELSSLHVANQAEGVKSVRVIGMTTSKASSLSELLAAVRPAIVICEEAGEVFESHVLASIGSHTQHLIMIGDYQQLRPKVENFELSMDSGQGYNLDESLFERLVRVCERRFGRQDMLNNGCLTLLHTQRRMQPDISDLIRHTLYPQLEDGENVKMYPNVKGMARNLWFFDHDHPESQKDQHGGGSYSNEWEAKMVFQLALRIVRQGYEAKDIAILTPYSGQLLKLREMFSERSLAVELDERTERELEDMIGGRLENNKKLAKQGLEGGNKLVSKQMKNCLRLSTVDNFQGEEALVVIVSTVRCNDKSKLGFLKIPNRVNVMMSRAKHGMYLFGSAKTIRNHRTPTILGNMLGIFQEKSAIGRHLPLRCLYHEEFSVKTPEDFDEKCPDGGCNLPCQVIRPCGHSCTRKCHPDDRNHRTPCPKDCTKPRKQCQHPCNKTCGEECGPCEEKVKVVLPCGHERMVPCCKKNDVEWIAQLQCRERVRNVHPLCGHTTMIACHQRTSISFSISGVYNADLYLCQQDCSGLLPCGHKCQRHCGTCTKLSNPFHLLRNVDRTVHGDCLQECRRDLFCGHTCGGKCHTSTECPPCVKVCTSQCSHSKCGKECKDTCVTCAELCGNGCRHREPCGLPCGTPCEMMPCEERCEEPMDCGHQCPSLCGERCPRGSQACRLCATENHKTQVVDVIMQTTLADHDLEDGPLIILPCNHVFTVESLDGIVQMSQFYVTDAGRTIVRLRERLPSCSTSNGDSMCPHCKVPQCPTCRASIKDIRRYARPLTYVSLNQNSRKFGVTMQNRIVEWEANLKILEDKFEVEGGSEAFYNDVQRLKESLRETDKSPIRSAMEKGIAECRRAKKGEKEEELKNLFKRYVDFVPIIGHKMCLARTMRIEMRAAAREETENKLGILKGHITRLRQKRVNMMLLCQESRSQNMLKKVRLATAEDLYHMIVISQKFPIAQATLYKSELSQHLVNLLQQAKSAGDDNADIIQQLYEASQRETQALTKEEKRAIFQAMGLAASSPYGGHFYTCPNGHVYTIGDCGGAMQESTCNECGSRIGGGAHRLLADNDKASEFLRDAGAI